MRFNQRCSGHSCLVSFGRAASPSRLGLDWNHLGLADAFTLAFDAKTFREADFDQHRIEKPPSIARSVPKRQAEYLAGRRVALAALRAAGSTVTDLSIGSDRAPLWPAGLVGSISHTDRIAVAVALPTAGRVMGVGIDVEHYVRPEHMQAISEMVIDAREYDVLADLAKSRSWTYALTLAFSAKESFYKATASTAGRVFDFSALRIRECNFAAAYIKCELMTPLAPSLQAGQSYILRWVEVNSETLLSSCVW